jgi:integrase
VAGTVRKRTWATKQGEIKTAWVADYFDQHSARHLKTFPTKTSATAWLAETRIDVLNGIHTPDRNSITVKEAAALWLKRRERLNERGSLRTYEQYTRLYIIPLLGAKKLSRLNTPTVEAFVDGLLEKKISRSRAQAVLSALKQILAEMMRRGLVAQNVALPVKVPDNDRIEAPVVIPSKAEIHALLQHAEGVSRPRLMTLIFTGLRASELRALTWANVDLEQRIIRVRQRADWWGTIGAPKSKHGYRDIPMTALLVNVLKEWRLRCRRTELDLAFPAPDGEPLSHAGLQHCFDVAQEAAGIAARYTLHALRHFFASWAIEQGFSPKKVQTLLGHGSIKMTYDVYGHLFPSEEEDHARLARGEAALLSLKLAPS